MSKLEDALWDADTALKKLKPEQGRIARKNARQRMLKALRKARVALDEEFPHERKPITSRKKPNPRRAVRGKTPISQGAHRQLLAAGVSPSQFIERGKPGATAHKIYAPKWMARAAKARLPASTIATAVRSQKVRRRIMATLRLKGI
jgi:hypothetical protein